MCEEKICVAHYGGILYIVCISLSNQILYNYNHRGVSAHLLKFMIKLYNAPNGCTKVRTSNNITSKYTQNCAPCRCISLMCICSLLPYTWHDIVYYEKGEGMAGRPGTSWLVVKNHHHVCGRRGYRAKIVTYQLGVMKLGVTWRNHFHPLSESMHVPIAPSPSPNHTPAVKISPCCMWRWTAPSASYCFVFP